MRKVEPIRELADIERIKRYLYERNERDYVLFMFGLYSGLRVGDILPLQVRDVTGDRIEVKERKTGKIKRFPINPELRKAISHYIEEQELENWDYLFPSRKKHRANGVRIAHIGRVAAYHIIKNAGDHIGLDNIGTHSMRKTFGYHHYKQNKNVVLLMEIFNHASPDITLRYIGYKQDELDDSMIKFAY